MAKLPVEVWSDIACPWCYIGKRRLETALDASGRRAAFEVTWRAFELDPRAPRVSDPSESQAQRLAKKYGRSVKEAEGMIARVRDLAREDGLAFDFDRIRPGNTFDGHRVVDLGRERGLQDAVMERLFSAYFCEGESIGDPEALVRLAAEAGLDSAEVQARLAGEDGAERVRADEREAQELGVSGVPFFVIGRRYAVSGAQPAELLRGALERAFSEARPAELAEGAVCGPEGC
jgi:predicted DsbA family dithiol-disulfide isomerase